MSFWNFHAPHAHSCADVGHPGRTNQYLVMHGDHLALTYNDTSVRAAAAAVRA